MRGVDLAKRTIPYLLTAAAVVAPWFARRGYILLTDFTFGPRIPLERSNNWLLPNALLKTLSLVMPADVVEKLFFAAVICILLWGGNKVAEVFIQDRWLVFAVSLFAVFNPFIYDRFLYGQIGVVLGVGFFLLGCGFLLAQWDLRERRQAIAAGIAFALAVLLSPHFIFFIACAGLLFFVLWRTCRPRVPWKTICLHAALILVCILVLNANWLFGHAGDSARALVQSGITEKDLVAFRTAGATPFEATVNVLMMSGFWGKDQFRYADLTKVSGVWGRSFLILLPLLAWGLWSGLKEKKWRGLAAGSLALFLVAVFLAIGIRLPVAREVTYWLFRHFPFYAALRETQKWVACVVLVYLIFLSLGTERLSRSKAGMRNPALVRILLGALIILQAPFLLWGFGGQARPAVYPAGWQAADRYLAAQGCPGQTLFLPWHLYMGFRFVGNVVAVPGAVFFRCPVVTGTNLEWGGIYDNSQSPKGKLVEEWLASRRNIGLLRTAPLDIRFIFLAKDSDWGNYLWVERVPGVTKIMDTDTMNLYRFDYAQ